MLLNLKPRVTSGLTLYAVQWFLMMMEGTGKGSFVRIIEASLILHCIGKRKAVCEVNEGTSKRLCLSEAPGGMYYFSHTHFQYC